MASELEPVAWACMTCNSPRSIDPCPKCGTPLTKPADGWEWPGLPDINRIRELAREVGYAVGVHGSQERDFDLIAAPWVAEAVEPLALAQHIADGLGGRVVDYERQDKPCGRWACNIHTPDWTKLIDLSVMPPLEAALLAAEQRGRESERAQADFPKWATDEHIANGILEAAETIVQLVIHNQTHRIAEYTGAIQSYAGTLLTRRAHIAKFLAASK